MNETNNYIFFYTGILSNWQPAKFFDPMAQVEFFNTEQAFMWRKADFFQDDATRTLIEQEKSAKAVKELGRQIKGYNDVAWQCVRYGYMTWVNYLKFSQNEEYKQFLLATGDNILVEASPYDRVWGIGLGEGDYPLILDEKNWLGQNLLGKSLMEVRNLLK